MDIDLSEIEQEFRRSWRAYDPGRYSAYLSQVRDQSRVELLGRLLSAELEYSFQPPQPQDDNETTVASEDDERIRPSIQLFMVRFPELSGQNEMIVRLSVLEYALRLRYDKIRPNPESYVALCHQSQERLTGLLQLTESKFPATNSECPPAQPVSHSDSTVKESQTSVSITLDPLPNNLGCFLLIRLIGKGGMGYVHSAIDLRSTAQVAVKVMRRVDPWSVSRFIDEFSWLSKLNHPNLVKLYDAFSEGEVRYFSMELVEGRTIREWFNRFSDVDDHRWDVLRRILVQAASAIHFLHQHGVIHCDIKCTNVMIASRRRAILLDLGLAVREGNCQPLVGTIQYMAPEVLDGNSPMRASDWYSFGIMLYEIITDDYPPIRVDALAENSDDRYRLDEGKLAENLAKCPEDLSSLCRDLIDSKASSRPSGSAVLQRLGGFSQDQDVIDPFHQIVGREEVLSRLNDAYAKSRESVSPIAVIRGESGIGKTSAIGHWLAQCDHDRDLLVLLQCYRQDHTPLRLLNLLVQELTRVLLGTPETEWRDSLSDRIDDISAVFPQVRQLIDAAVPAESQQRSAASAYSIQNKGMQALAGWLVDLSQTRRLLLIIDDAQWADGDSLNVLSDLLCADQFRGMIVIVDADLPSIVDSSMRCEIIRKQEDRFVDAWHDVEVPPLCEESCLELVSSWTDNSAIDIAPAVRANIAQRSGGSPFLLQELYRAYTHYKKREGNSDDQWLNTDSSNNVRRRFSMLPIQSETVLQFLAVAVQPIGFHLLRTASRIPPHELQRTLSLLTFQGWVRSRTSGPESEFEIAHENFRNAVLDSLPLDRLHRRHYRMARMLSTEVPPPWSRMAGHYWLAECKREATACYLEAALVAMRSSSFNEALFFLERAEHEDADRSSAERDRVTRLRADCLAGDGNAIAAAKIYDSLAESSENPEEKVNMRCLAGEQWIRAGQLDSGLSRLREVLCRLGITNMKIARISQFCLRCRTLIVALGNASSANAQRSSGQSFSSMEQCLNRISIPLTFLNNQLGPDLILRLKMEAEKRGSEFDRSLAILHWAMLLSFAGRRWRKIAARWLGEGRRLARRSGSPAAMGTAQLCLFIWHTQKGAVRKAITHGELAINWLEREPRKLQWEIQFLHWGMLGNYWFSCQLKKLCRSAAQQRQSAVDRSDSMSQFWMNVGAAHWAHLVVDDVERARDAIRIATNAISNQSFQSPRFFLWLSRIQQELYEGRPAAARDIMSRDWGHLNKHYVLSTNHYRWHALRMRLCCELVCIRENCGDVPAAMRDARRSLRKMAKLQEPTFVAYGNAFQLLLDVLDGTIPTSSRWQEVIDQLHGAEHHMYAHALEWHKSLYASDAESRGSGFNAKQTLREEGCIAPEKLLDTILPLPVHS